MKRIFFVLAGLLCFLSIFSNQNFKPVTIEIPSYPETINEFITLRNEIATTPEGGAAMFALAMYVYSQDKVLGMKCFIVSVVNNSSMLRDSASNDAYKGKEPANHVKYLINQLNNKLYVCSSYFLNTSPQNGYEIPSFPLQVRSIRNKYSEQYNGAIKVFVTCTGADSPRPVTLLKNNRGIWKVEEFSSLVVGIRPPVEEIDDDL